MGLLKPKLMKDRVLHQEILFPLSLDRLCEGFRRYGNELGLTLDAKVVRVRTSKRVKADAAQIGGAGWPNVYIVISKLGAARFLDIYSDPLIIPETLGDKLKENLGMGGLVEDERAAYKRAWDDYMEMLADQVFPRALDYALSEEGSTPTPPANPSTPTTPKPTSGPSTQTKPQPPVSTRPTPRPTRPVKIPDYRVAHSILPSQLRDGSTQNATIKMWQWDPSWPDLRERGTYSITFTVPAHSHDGTEVRLAGRGYEYQGGGGTQRGDLVVVLHEVAEPSADEIPDYSVTVHVPARTMHEGGSRSVSITDWMWSQSEQHYVRDPKGRTTKVTFEIPAGSADGSVVRLPRHGFRKGSIRGTLVIRLVEDTSATPDADEQQRTREEAERKAREEAERRAREETQRRVREETERKRREEAERRAQEEARRKAREAAAASKVNALNKLVFVTRAEAAGGCTKSVTLDDGRRVSFDVPRGANPATKIRLPGQGRLDKATGVRGELVISIAFSD